MNDSPRGQAPTLGLAKAAEACGKSVSTIRRRREELLREGATITEKGWQIPIPALVSLGLMDSKTAPPDTAPAVGMEPATVSHADGVGVQALAEVAELRQLLVAAEARAQVAEAIAVERERIIEVQAQALRMLEPGSSDTSGNPAKGSPDRLPDTPTGTPSEASIDTPPIAPVRSSKGRLRRLLGF